MPRRVLVTVGSTKFDLLIQYATSPSSLSALKKKGYTNVVFQYGNSQWTTPPSDDSLSLEAYPFKPSLADDMSSADLVISHAGSGTILDALRASKALIVVPNNTLMDDHQSELARELSKSNYLVTCSPENLAATIEAGAFDNLAPFPRQDKTRFQSILDEEMGFD